MTELPIIIFIILSAVGVGHGILKTTKQENVHVYENRPCLSNSPAIDSSGAALHPGTPAESDHKGGCDTRSTGR